MSLKGIEVIIYVLPTEEDLPPRAILGEEEDGKIVGSLATWSRDMGTWLMEGMPLPQELCDAITEHAKNLGVATFLQ